MPASWSPLGCRRKPPLDAADQLQALKPFGVYHFQHIIAMVRHPCCHREESPIDLCCSLLEHDTLPLRRHRQSHDVSCSLSDTPAYSKRSMHTQAPVHKATWYQQQFPHSAGGALLLLDADARVLHIPMRKASPRSRSSVLCINPQRCTWTYCAQGSLRQGRLSRECPRLPV